MNLSNALLRAFAEGNKKAQAQSSDALDSQNTAKTGGNQAGHDLEGSEPNEIILETHKDGKQQMKGGRIIENLGQIDTELPELRNYEAADILRTLDFTSRIAPALSKLRSLGLTDAQITTTAARFPSILTTASPASQADGPLDVLTLASLLQQEYQLKTDADIRRLLLDCPEVLSKSAVDFRLSVARVADVFKLEQVGEQSYAEPPEAAACQVSLVLVRPAAT